MEKRKVLVIHPVGGRKFRIAAGSWKQFGNTFVGYGGQWGGEVVASVNWKDDYLAWEIMDETEDDEFLLKLTTLSLEDLEKVRNFATTSGIIR